MENETKKRPIALIVIIVILSLALIGAGCYLLYDKTVLGTAEEQEEQENPQEPEEENLSFTDERFYPIYEKIQPYSYTQSRENGYQSFTVDELLNIIKDDFQAADFVPTEEVTQWGDFYYLCNQDVLERNLRKYFVPDATMDAEALSQSQTQFSLPQEVNLSSGLTFHGYDADTKNYKVRFSGIGEDFGPRANIKANQLMSATLQDDTILVKEQVIYYDFSIDAATNQATYQIYSDVTKSNLIDTKVLPINEMRTTDPVSIEEYHQTSTITYTFVQNEDGTYAFISSVIE